MLAINRLMSLDSLERNGKKTAAEVMLRKEKLLYELERAWVSSEIIK